MKLGWPEILLILAVVLIVFGAGKLPQTMKDLGKGVREFRKSQKSNDDEDDKEVKPVAGGVDKEQDELTATRARLAAAEAKVKELEQAHKT
jgi:sec-independent protein translocase protein TatA